MFLTFIFSLLFTTVDYSFPARRVAMRVVFDVGGSTVGESDARRNIHGRKKCLCEIAQHFTTNVLEESHKQWWCYVFKAPLSKFIT